MSYGRQCRFVGYLVGQSSRISGFRLINFICICLGNDLMSLFIQHICLFVTTKEPLFPQHKDLNVMAHHMTPVHLQVEGATVSSDMSAKIAGQRWAGVVSF